MDNMSSHEIVVQAIDLSKRFGTFTAVDGATFGVNHGEIFGLVGPNGAGKSTLIKMLTTLLPVTSGRASIAGFDVERQAADVRRHIGYVPQLLSADGQLTGYQNLLLSARLYGVPISERKTRITRALEGMGLSEVADRLVQHYSGGMIRRLEIAQSLLHRPAVLFLDEPTVGLDPVARRAVWDHVRLIRTRLKTTIVMTSHYMDEVDQQCDRMALIDRGRIAAIGTPSELKEKAGTGATLDDVFVQLTSGTAELEGNYRDVERARLAAREHG